MTEDKVVGRHHQFNRDEFQQTPGNSGGQGSLACCSPWGRKELGATERVDKSIYILGEDRLLSLVHDILIFARDVVSTPLQFP